MQNYLGLVKNSQWITYSPVVKGKVEIDTCTCIISLRHPKNQTESQGFSWVKSDLMPGNLKARSSEWFA